MTKLSPYQKLKQQNLDLTQQITILVEDPDSHEADAIRTKWNVKINLGKPIPIKGRKTINFYDSNKRA